MRQTSLVRTIARGAGLVGLSLLLLTSTAEARDKRHRDRNRDHDRQRHSRHFDYSPRRDHQGQRHQRRPKVRHRREFRRFEIPSRISSRRDFRRFRHRDVYYRPHRHAHRIYMFPVFDGHDHVYRPFHYCDGRRFSVDYHRPGFRIGLRF